jgi:hypothetical protein
MREKQALPCSMRSGKPWMQGERSSFSGILTNDDDTLAHLDFLLSRRLSLTLL